MSKTDLSSKQDKGEISRGFQILLWGMGVGGMLSIMVSHGLYWYFRLNFAETDQVKTFPGDVWGQYGDFIGGISNPFLSLLTFAGLLYTIVVQRSELTLQRRELANSSQALKATEEELRQTKEIAAGQADFYRQESKKSEIEKVMSILSSSVDKNLAYIPKGHLRLNCNDMFFAHARYMVESFKGEKKYNFEFEKEGLPEEIEEDFKRHIFQAISDLVQLDIFMGFYQKYDINSAILYYYYVKYGRFVAEILNTELLHGNLTVISLHRNP